MSESLQFEHHPDADQIGAFVEQALPAHERELLLSHLAVCSDCRAVVALSLPELEAPAQPVAAPARKPWSRARSRAWWRGWAVALPLAGALAASILTVIYLHPTPSAPVAHESQLAVAHREPQLPVQAPAPQSVATEQPAAPAARQALSEARKTAPAQAVAIAPARASQALASGHALGGPVVTGRNFATLRMQSEAPRAGASPNAFPTAKAARITSGSASANSAFNPAAPIAPPVVQVPPGTATNATQTVSVQAAGLAIDAASADLSNQAIAEESIQAAPPRRPLPSHLAILSSATLGKRIVAIDAAHNVFASKDAGKHWMPLLTPWQGRPMQASLTQSSRAASLAGLASFAPIAVPPAPPSTAAPSTLNGTVTDRTGAVIPGASVTATEIATGVSHTARTDAAGHYDFGALPPGAYRVDAQFPGFRKQQVPSVAVQPTGPATANLTLDVAESTQTVTVQAGNEPLNAESAKKSRPRSQAETAPLFQIVTDSGDRWTSSDGLHWNHN
jgi:hypothetical protein